MDKCNSKIHNRHSIRLKGYDYSQSGMYFITICTQNRKQLFGNIKNGKMILNDAGGNADKCWLQIPDHFPNTVLHAHIIMPNHVHGIIEITESVVGAKNLSPVSYNGAKDFSPLPSTPSPPPSLPRSPSKTIGSIVRGYKIGVTKWFRQCMGNQFPVKRPVWQRNYWEHIIRNEREYNRISEYIVGNPLKWYDDKLNDKNGDMVMENRTEYNFETWMV